MITFRAIFSQIQLTQLNRPNNFETAQHIMRLILASSSKYRREILARLQLPFDTESPDIDESPLPGEHPRQLARRLSAAKADTVASRYPGAVVIGSDQVACLSDGTPIGKPGNIERARIQLRRMSGQAVEFHSALCVTAEITRAPCRERGGQT